MPPHIAGIHNETNAKVIDKTKAVTAFTPIIDIITTIAASRVPNPEIVTGTNAANIDRGKIVIKCRTLGRFGCSAAKTKYA